MAAKTRNKQRKPSAFKTQNLLNRVITAGVETKFTPDDYIIIDFLNRTSTQFGDFPKKINVNTSCCWSVDFMFATVPTRYATPEYLDYVRETSKKPDEKVNCDIFELRYIHEGLVSFDTIHIVASKIFLEFIDPQTSLLEAQAKFKPMSLTDRLKTHGPFKNVVEINDNLDIEYWFDSNRFENYSLFERPCTNS